MFVNRIRAGAPACLLALLLGASGLAGCASTAETGQVAEGEFYEETRRIEGPVIVERPVIEEPYEPGMFAEPYEEEINYPDPIGGPDLWPYGPDDPSLLDVAPPWLPPLGGRR